MTEPTLSADTVRMDEPVPPRCPTCDAGGPARRRSAADLSLCPDDWHARHPRRIAWYDKRNPQRKLKDGEHSDGSLVGGEGLSQGPPTPGQGQHNDG